GPGEANVCVHVSPASAEWNRSPSVLIATTACGSTVVNALAPPPITAPRSVHVWPPSAERRTWPSALKLPAYRHASTTDEETAWSRLRSSASAPTVHV